MPVDPFLESFLATPIHTPEVIDDYPAYRAMRQAAGDAGTTQLSEPGPEVKERREVSIPVEGGTIDLLIYQPFEPGPHPAHVFVHGGAFILGSIHDASTDILCRERCIGARCVVVAVDYRKAPEYKFPTPLNDCYAALTWVADHAEELGVHPSQITIGGQSAGGNIAAALALKARDEGGPHLTFQLLEVPGLDMTLSHLRHEFGSGYAVSSHDLEIVRRDYLHSPEEATNPYASPLLAPDLSGLPPALIMPAEYDILRGDGEVYAQRLEQAGVPVTYSMQPGHIHGSGSMTKVMASARAWRETAITALARAHDQGETAQTGKQK